ncbi:unnamed protein product [Trichogramma brassicae]|uniref:Reverse transcriptase domain-containing protein n=1 Tax=Trichogramma brassicae TaxID=86971 RepID=A0A6H5IBI4_9HYME|nr:unnamed protein product [Trichogramma brassicae]
MLDSCLKDGVFPVKWKEAQVVTLLKSADKDPAQPRSYRPVSLRNGWSKVLERMMVERMLVRKRGECNDGQYGFRENRCTEDVWSKLCRWKNESFRTYVAGVFVDFKGAFDNLKSKMIVRKIRETEVEGNELRLWLDYFKDRRVCMKSRTVQCVWKRVERGCPQGSQAKASDCIGQKRMDFLRETRAQSRRNVLRVLYFPPFRRLMDRGLLGGGEARRSSFRRSRRSRVPSEGSDAGTSSLRRNFGVRIANRGETQAKCLTPVRLDVEAVAGAFRAFRRLAAAVLQCVWTCTKNAIGCCAGPTVRGERGVRWRKQCVRTCAFRATRPDWRHRCEDTPVEQQRHVSDAYGLVRVTIPPVAAAYEQVRGLRIRDLGRCEVSEVSERRMATRANTSRSDAYGLGAKLVVATTTTTFAFTEKKCEDYHHNLG